MKEYKLNGHASSLLPDGKEWILAWNDEFDGTELDMSKWDYRLSMMGQLHKTWGTEGVRIDGHSHAIFSPYEKDGVICTSQLQTGYNFMDAVPEKRFSKFLWPIGKLREHKHLHRYGYYECRCKLQKKPGWWTAFWVQSPCNGATLDPAVSGIEHDIMESFEPGVVIPHMLHHGGCGADLTSIPVGEGRRDLDLDAFHTFGMEWDENGYTFYIDGEPDGHHEGVVSHIPEFIMLSAEVNGYRHGDDATDEGKAAVGDEFIVDYVRVFDRV